MNWLCLPQMIANQSSRDFGLQLFNEIASTGSPHVWDPKLRHFVYYHYD